MFCFPSSSEKNGFILKSQKEAVLLIIWLCDASVSYFQFFKRITKEQIDHLASYLAQNYGSSSKFSPPLESCGLLRSFVYIKFYSAEIWSMTKMSCYVTLLRKADINEVKLQVNHCTNYLSEFQHFHWSFSTLGHNLWCSAIVQFKLKKKKKKYLWRNRHLSISFITLQTIRKVEKKTYFPLASN